MTQKMKVSIPDYRQIISGIDKLNYQLSIDYVDYTKFYNKFILTADIIADSDLELVGSNKQYQIFRCNSINNIRASARQDQLIDWLCFIKFKNLNKNDYLESISIEVNSIMLQVYTLEYINEMIVDKINSYGLTVLTTKISRVDLNAYVYGFDFSWISDSYFSTNAKNTNEIKSNRVLETFYLGSRASNSIFLRIYNKWKELQESEHLQDDTRRIKKSIIELKLKYKGVEPSESIPLWNIEFEVKREKLKQYGITTIEDLSTYANSLFNKLVTKNRLLIKKTFKGDTHRSDIPNHPIWDFIKDHYDLNKKEIIPMQEIKQKKYKKDEIYTINRLNEIIEENKNDFSKRFFVEILERTKHDILDLLKSNL